MFLGMIWGQISDTFPFKNEPKLPEMVYIIPNFLVLHLGVSSWKSKQKKAKLYMHEGQFAQQMLYTANMLFNPFKMAAQFF